METGLAKINGTTPANAQLAVLNEYDRNKYNVLAPLSIHALSPFHAIGVEIVELSPDPKQGDCFKTGSAKNAAGQWENVLALSKVALLKLGDAAGVVWDVSECKRLDNYQNPLYVAFQAQGRIRRPDGTWIKVRATKEIDLEVIREEIRERVDSDSSNANLSEEQREAKAFKDWIQKRKHKGALCESGAMNRVLRQLLKIKSGYTPAEIAKPFVIARVDLNLSSDERLREAFSVRVRQDIADLFGGEGPEPARLAQADKVLALAEPKEDRIVDTDTGEITEEIEDASDDDDPADLVPGELFTAPAEPAFSVMPDSVLCADCIKAGRPSSIPDTDGHPAQEWGNMTHSVWGVVVCKEHHEARKAARAAKKVAR